LARNHHKLIHLAAKPPHANLLYLHSEVFAMYVVTLTLKKLQLISRRKNLGTKTESTFDDASMVTKQYRKMSKIILVPTAAVSATVGAGVTAALYSAQVAAPIAWNLIVIPPFDSAGLFCLLCSLTIYACFDQCALSEEGTTTTEKHYFQLAKHGFPASMSFNLA
jgi:hypothetical protein